MGVLKNIKKENIILSLAVVLLAVIGHYLFFQFLDYTYKSPENIHDFLLVKLWSLGWILFACSFIYLLRSKISTPLWSVFFLSVYFVVLYGLLFIGTEYGMNSHFGDNAYRLAITSKMMAYNYFADANVKGLATFYPPLWFWIMSVYAKILNIEAYQTIKFGYLFIFLLYPWMLYFAWRPLVSRIEAAAVTVAVIFFAHNYLNYIFYEHITAALFVPWWLYFFENATGKEYALKKQWLFYLSGAIIGAFIFMTYYWWFFMAFAVLPITSILKWHQKKSFRYLLFDLRHKLYLMVGVALFSSFYWLPLVINSIKFGLVSNQSAWFNLHYVHIAQYWKNFIWEGLIVFAGIFFLGYLWDRWKESKLAYLYLGGFLLIMVDRYLNLESASNQTRKLLEFSHLFAVIPLALGITLLWKKPNLQKQIKHGLVFLLLILIITFSDNQSSEIFSSPRYVTGVNQRKPDVLLDVFSQVDCYNTVFLTNKVYETCYLPFYKFISTSSTGSHLNGRFNARLQFLKKLSKIDKPEYVSYLLAYNKYDTINYVFLPYNGSTNSYELTINVRKFTGENVAELISLSKPLFLDNQFFSIKHQYGLYQVNANKRSKEFDALVQEKYPELYLELR